VRNGDTQSVAIKRGWTRARTREFLMQRYNTRVHMSLILASCALAAMATSALLLHAGVLDMRARYPVAMVAAYLTFLLGVWVWLRCMGMAPKGSRGSSASLDGDIPDLSIGQGGGGGLRLPSGVGPRGGTFDGGGASASWMDGARAPSAQSVSLRGGASGSSGKGLGGVVDGLDIDGDGIALLILALVVVLAVFATSGYLIWMAPDVFTEAAFGTLLAGGLARPTRNEAAGGWMAGVIKKTWWPFAIVLVVALVFAHYSATHFPEAKTFRQAVTMALHR